MSVKKIKEFNEQKFLDDLKRVRDVLVQPDWTQAYFRVTKKDVKKMAETCEIKYYMTDKIFVVKRDVMVIK